MIEAVVTRATSRANVARINGTLQLLMVSVSATIAAMPSPSTRKKSISGILLDWSFTTDSKPVSSINQYLGARAIEFL
jgi:hypothetical protein